MPAVHPIASPRHSPCYVHSVAAAERARPAFVPKGLLALPRGEQASQLTGRRRKGEGSPQASSAQNTAGEEGVWRPLPAHWRRCVLRSECFQSKKYLETLIAPPTAPHEEVHVALLWLPPPVKGVWSSEGRKGWSEAPTVRQQQVGHSWVQPLAAGAVPAKEGPAPARGSSCG